MTKKIAVLPGDGIGPEIIAEAVKVLDTLKSRFGLEIEMELAPIGGAGYDAAKQPCRKQHLSSPKRPMPCCLARSAGHSMTTCRASCARAWVARHPLGIRAFFQSAPGAAVSAVGACFYAQTGSGLWARYLDRARN